MNTWLEIVQSQIPEVFKPVSIEQMEGIFRLIISSWQVNTESFDSMETSTLLYCSIVEIIAGNKEYIKTFTEYQGRKHLMSYILDILISCANDREEYEIQLLLTDYKYRNGIFRKNKLHL